MIKFDVIIIGGGMAGYSAGLKCLQAGLKTAIISQGQSALHFSSGSIDLLAQTPEQQTVNKPFDTIARYPELFPDHPYAKLGVEPIRQALDWYQSTLAQLELPLAHQANEENHYRITPMGTLKATWMSQPYVYQLSKSMLDNGVDFDRIAMISIDGYRDFQPQITKDNLAKLPAFQKTPIVNIKLTLQTFKQMKRNKNELRSIDLARMLRDPQEFKFFADQLIRYCNHRDLVVLPAIMGNGDGLELLHKLQQLTNLTFHEVPTMPPSLLGIRLEESMSRAFVRHNGTHLKGDQVLTGMFKANDTNQTLQLEHILTQNFGDTPLQASHYILATGSFFSQGLKATLTGVNEPIFNLDTKSVPDREQWHQSEFFTNKSHPFMGFGVLTNSQFQPSLNSQTISNLYCAGAILSGYDPITEGCGSGVAISTAHHAATAIIAQHNSKIEQQIASQSAPEERQS